MSRKNVSALLYNTKDRKEHTAAARFRVPLRDLKNGALRLSTGCESFDCVGVRAAVEHRVCQQTLQTIHGTSSSIIAWRWTIWNEREREGGRADEGGELPNELLHHLRFCCLHSGALSQHVSSLFWIFLLLSVGIFPIFPSRSIKLCSHYMQHHSLSSSFFLFAAKAFIYVRAFKFASQQ